METAKEEIKNPFSMDAELTAKTARRAWLEAALNLDTALNEPKPEGITADIAAFGIETVNKEMQNTLVISRRHIRLIRIILFGEFF